MCKIKIDDGDRINRNIFVAILCKGEFVQSRILTRVTVLERATSAGAITIPGSQPFGIL